MELKDPFDKALGKVLMVYTLKDPEVRHDFNFYKNEISQRVGAKGETNFKKLGEGMNGYVFWLPDKKKVLKITRDLKDAQASAVVIKKPDKNLIKVYDVFEFGDPYYFKSYGIVSEKLSPLSSSDEREWRTIVLIAHGRYSQFGAPKMFDLDPKWVDKLEAWSQSEDAEMFQALVSPVQKLLPTLRLWAEALTKRGLGWGDLNLGNVMMKGRIPIISDLGFGSVNSPPDIPEIELEEE